MGLGLLPCCQQWLEGSRYKELASERLEEEEEEEEEAVKLLGEVEALTH